jgi:hypothetical protein
VSAELNGRRRGHVITTNKPNDGQGGLEGGGRTRGRAGRTRGGGGRGSTPANTNGEQRPPPPLPIPRHHHPACRRTSHAETRPPGGQHATSRRNASPANPARSRTTTQPAQNTTHTQRDAVKAATSMSGRGTGRGDSAGGQGREMANGRAGRRRRGGISPPSRSFNLANTTRRRGAHTPPRFTGPIPIPYPCSPQRQRGGVHPTRRPRSFVLTGQQQRTRGISPRSSPPSARYLNNGEACHPHAAPFVRTRRPTTSHGKRGDNLVCRAISFSNERGRINRPRLFTSFNYCSRRPSFTVLFLSFERGGLYPPPLPSLING